MVTPSIERQRAINAHLDALNYDFKEQKINPLLEAVSQHQQHPISLHLYKTAKTYRKPVAFWIPTPLCDFIVIATPTKLNNVLLMHYIGHELGHILLKHTPRPLELELPLDELAQAIPVIGKDVDVSVWELLVGHQRSMSPDDPEEVEAEYVARQIQQRFLQANRQASSNPAFQGKCKEFIHIPTYMGFRK